MTSKKDQQQDNIYPQIPSGDDRFTLDKEFSSIFTSDDFDNLEQQILNDKVCREPLTIWEEMKILIDGHTRLKICQKHKIPYEITMLPCKDRDAVVEWIFKNQKNKRNMSKFLWAVAVLNRKAHFTALGKENQRANALCQNSDNPVNTLEILAELAGVSRDTMHKVGVIMDTAAAEPTNQKLKEQIEALKRNEAGVSIHSVYEGIKKTDNKEEPSKPSKTAKNITNHMRKGAKFHLNFLEDQLIEDFPEIKDRILLYELVVELAKAKKKELSAQKKKASKKAPKKKPAKKAVPKKKASKKKPSKKSKKKK